MEEKNTTKIPTVCTDPALQEAYESCVGRIEKEISWYWQNRKIKKFWSIYLRAIAIVFAVIGSICPLIMPLLDKVYPEWTPLISSSGYVFLALGAAFMWADKALGLSTAWMRYVLAAQELESCDQQLKLRWNALRLKYPEGGSKEFYSEAFCIIQEISLQVNEVIQNETKQWVHDFKVNLDALEQKISQR